MHFTLTAKRLCLFAAASQLFSSAHAHSWPEAANIIDKQGTFVDPTGYSRNFVPRNASGFQGSEQDSFQKTQVIQGAKTCMDRQTQQIQSPGYPRLTVQPEDAVALRYAENGHVTIEQAGRPPQGGPVYIFGTTDGTDNPLLTDVMAWNSDGTGGNKNGKLLMTQNFDDGRCYEDNSSQNSSTRAAANPLNGQLALPYFSGMPCQNDFVVPSDAPVGKPYTIFWVWNFTMTNGQGVEIYSVCLDFDVVAPSTGGAANKAAGPPSFNTQQAPISAAVVSYFDAFGKAATGVAASAPTSAVSQASAASPALVSEPASGGGIYVSSAATDAPSAADATVTKLVTVTPEPAMKTVYVTVEPGQESGKGTGTRKHRKTHCSSDHPTSAGQKPKPTDGASSSPETTPSSPTTAAPSEQSVSGQAIPLITIGSSGPVVVVVPPTGAASASAPSAGTPSAGAPAATVPVASSAANTPSAGAPAASAATSSVAVSAAEPLQPATASVASPSAVPVSAATPSAGASAAEPLQSASVTAASPSAPSANPAPTATSAGGTDKQPDTSQAASAAQSVQTATPTMSASSPCKNKRVIKKSRMFAHLGQDEPPLPQRDGWGKHRRFVS